MRCLIPASYNYLSFLREVKEMGVRVVLEYPTYPYDDEVKNEDIIREDKEYREQIGQFVHRVSHIRKG